MSDLSSDLHALGNQVIVLTTTPHYNVDHELLKKQPLRRRWFGLFYTSDLGGIPVYHVPIRRKKSRLMGRALDYIGFHVMSTILGLMSIHGYQLVLAPSPPLTVGLFGWLLSALKGVPFVYNVQEIFPDVAVRLGLIKGRRTIRFFERMERFIYARSEKVVVISEWFRQSLMRKGVPEGRIQVIPNFVDTEFIKPACKDNVFSQAHNLVDKFVVLYSGNIGLTQGFETILEAAGHLKDDPQLKFVIIGDGARRDWLERELKAARLDNIVLLPYQPRSMIPWLYASADLCLVPLKSGTAQETFPSKVYTIMAAGRAVLALSEADCELAWVIEHADCGWRSDPDRPDQMESLIRSVKLKVETLAEKGKNGRAFVVKHYSRQVVAHQYDSVIRAFCESGG